MLMIKFMGSILNKSNDEVSYINDVKQEIESIMNCNINIMRHTVEGVNFPKGRCLNLPFSSISNDYFHLIEICMKENYLNENLKKVIKTFLMTLSKDEIKNICQSPDIFHFTWIIYNGLPLFCLKNLPKIEESSKANKALNWLLSSDNAKAVELGLTNEMEFLHPQVKRNIISNIYFITPSY